MRCRMGEDALTLSIFLALPKETPQYRPDMTPLRRRKPLDVQIWQEERESAPTFTFLLRPRVMQIHGTCKLLCCLSGKPTPTVRPENQ